MYKVLEGLGKKKLTTELAICCNYLFKKNNKEMKVLFFAYMHLVLKFWWKFSESLATTV